MITQSSTWRLPRRLIGGMSLLIAIIVLCSVLPAHAETWRASATVASNWPMLNYNTSGVRSNPNETILNASNIHNLARNWAFYSWNLSTMGSSAAVVNGIVYFGANDYNIYAVKAKTGVLVWKYTTGNGVDSSPTVVNGIVYVGSNDNNVYALNAKTGVLLWKQATGAPVNSSPTAVNGIVYVGDDDGNLYALNALTGAVVWTYYTGATVVRSTPAVANGEVYIISATTLYALSAKTGKLRWSFNTGGGYNYSSPAVVNGVVYVWNMAGSAGGTLYALNAQTGSVNWFYGSSWFAGSLAIVNGVIYFYAANSFNAMNASTGVILWSNPSGWDPPTSPAAANGLVYFLDASGNLNVADASSGTILLVYTGIGGLSTAITVADGEVFGGGGSGAMLAFHLPA